MYKTIFIIIILFLMQFMYFNNKIDNSKIKIQKEYLTFDKTGQIYITPNGNFSMYGFNGKDLEIGTGGNIIINAGNDKIELKVGNTNKIEITKDKINIIGEVYINNNLFNN